MKKLILSLLLCQSVSYGYTISHNDYTSGAAITASGQNTNENNIVNVINGNLEGSTANSGGSATNILQGTVSTPDLRPNAVTVSSASYTMNCTPIGGCGVQTTTATFVTIATIGKPVLLLANMNITGANSSSNITLSRNNTQLTSQPQCLSSGGAASNASQCTVFALDTPPAGSNTYYLTYTPNGSVTVYSYNLIAIELRD